jgi:crotonobetainyl-CoA:carnitine CoA-transferase CaiB-like acyl-CoA transferase
MKILEDLFITKPAKYWLDELERVGVPAGPINDFAQVFADEQVRSRGMEVKVKHPLRDDLSLIRNPLTFSGTPITDYRAPPLLGQNTDEVLKGKLGYTDARIAELRKANIIQQAG